MEKYQTLNAHLAELWPAAHSLLSPLGLRAAFPDGVPAQAAEASGCKYNGTIGQVTDGHGNALPLPSLAAQSTLFAHNSALLYPPQLGLLSLRQEWAARTNARSDGEQLFPPPMVTVALTHGVSLCADLFTDENTTVLMPAPSWGNYKAIFGLRRGAKLAYWSLYDDDDRLNLSGLEQALNALTGRAVLVLNFPGNPSGYTPTVEEAEAIAQLIQNHPHPLLLLCDDAYQGLTYEEGILERSMFYRLAEIADPQRHLVVKIDGATKELAFFGGRVGFLTFGTPETVANALLDKAAAIARATVSSAPAPSQLAVLNTLKSPTVNHEIADLKATLARRYRRVQSATAQLVEAGIHPLPFNSGCFALLRLPKHLNAHDVRKKLIQEASVGFVALPQHHALRIAYCSMSEDQIQPALDHLAAVLA